LPSGRSLVALSSEERLIETLGHGVDVGGEEVAVAIQGDRDRRVAKMVLDHLGVLTLSDQD